MEDRDPTPLEYWKKQAKTRYVDGWFTGYMIAVILFTVLFPSKGSYRPYGKLSDKETRAEVLIHRVDPHRVYTCENDPIVGDQTPGHYAVIDQVEALDAGYTPMGQGYCQ